MRRTAIGTVFILGLAGSACTLPEGGSIDLQIGAVAGPVADTYAIDWDGGVTWTREVGCAIDGGDEPNYHVAANDRSQGELSIAIELQAFDGPGDYARDEFQPRPLLLIDWTDEETGDAWHLGTDSGGRCAVTVEEPSLSGFISCVEVGVFVNAVRTEDLASIDAVWNCAQVERDNPLIATRNRSGRGPSL